MSEQKSPHENLRDALIATHNDEAVRLDRMKDILFTMQQLGESPDSPEAQYLLGRVMGGTVVLQALQATLMIETANDGDPLDPSQFPPLP